MEKIEKSATIVDKNGNLSHKELPKNHRIYGMMTTPLFGTLWIYNKYFEDDKWKVEDSIYYMVEK